VEENNYGLLMQIFRNLMQTKKVNGMQSTSQHTLSRMMCLVLCDVNPEHVQTESRLMHSFSEKKRLMEGIVQVLPVII
jgi:hypothetical protein